MQDETLWMQGIYMRNAVGSAMNDKNKYPSEPLFSDIFDKQIFTEEELEQRAIQKAIASEMMWMQNAKQRHLPDKI